MSSRCHEAAGVSVTTLVDAGIPQAVLFNAVIINGFLLSTSGNQSRRLAGSPLAMGMNNETESILPGSYGAAPLKAQDWNNWQERAHPLTMA